MAHSLRSGDSVLVSDPKKALDIFVFQAEGGRKGLMVARNPPTLPRLLPVTVLRLSTERHTHPGYVLGTREALVEVEKFIRRNRRSIMFLEGLEYLKVRDGIEPLLRGLQVLRDLVSNTHAQLLVVYDPLAFKEEERALIAREFRLINGALDDARWRAVSLKLDADARALYEAVRGKRGQLHQADLTKALGWSKAKTSRLLDRLEDKYLLIRRREGMGNLVVLT